MYYVFFVVTLAIATVCVKVNTLDASLNDGSVFKPLDDFKVIFNCLPDGCGGSLISVILFVKFLITDV